MRGTVIDLGSSTFHVLIADVDEVGIRNVLYERKVPVRITQHSTHHVLASVGEMLARVEGQRRIVATSAFREQPELAERIEQTLGIQIEVLSGDDEARLTWTGVSAELAGSHGKLAVLDLGGGSLEVVWGQARAESAHTWPLGVLRLTGDNVRRRVVAETAAAIAQLQAYAPDTVVVTSGTARALLRLSRKLGLVASGQRHMWRRTFGELARAIAMMKPEALMEHGVDRSRVDTIGTGATIFDALLDRLDRPVAYVARSALREGALIDLARSQQQERRVSL